MLFYLSLFRLGKLGGLNSGTAKVSLTHVKGKPANYLSH